MTPEEMLAAHPQIRQVPIFSCLTPDELNGLLSVSEVLDFPAEARIVEQNEVGDSLFAVVRGNVAVLVKDIQDNEIIISRLQRGEVFGEAAIFMTTRRTASVIATSPTSVVKIRRHDMLNFFREHPHAGNKILMIIILALLKKLKNTNEDLVLEKQPEIDFDYVDDMVQEFITESDTDEPE